MDAARALKFMMINCALLLVVGLVMVFSTSFIFAGEVYGNPYYFALRQLTFVMLGLFLIFFVSKTKVSFWFKYSIHIHVFCSLLVLLTFYILPSMLCHLLAQINQILCLHYIG